jgi:hypothetical protein
MGLLAEESLIAQRLGKLGRLNQMPCPGLARTLASGALRTSSGPGGDRRRSAPIRPIGQGSAGQVEDETRHSFLEDMR